MNSEKIPFWSNLCRNRGWPSTSKFLSVAGGLTSLFVLVWTTLTGYVPTRLPELVGLVIFALVLGRGVSKGLNVVNEIKNGNDDKGS